MGCAVNDSACEDSWVRFLVLRSSVASASPELRVTLCVRSQREPSLRCRLHPTLRVHFSNPACALFDPRPQSPSLRLRCVFPAGSCTARAIPCPTPRAQGCQPRGTHPTCELVAPKVVPKLPLSESFISLDLRHCGLCGTACSPLASIYDLTHRGSVDLAVL